MQLHEALSPQKGDIVSFVGAGGKTSALTRLGTELAALGWRVLAITTTRIAQSELKRFPHVIPYSDFDQYPTEQNFVFIYDYLNNDKVIGLSVDDVHSVIQNHDFDILLIEADGSRRLPLKAPRDHEPVIPIESTIVIPVVGMDALGENFSNKVVYNLPAIQQVLSIDDERQIRPHHIATIMSHSDLGLKNIPNQARVIPLLNKTPNTQYGRILARRIARQLLKNTRLQAVAIGQVQQINNPVLELQQRVAAIILAGGVSRRMGEPKQLLPWGSQTVIEAIMQHVNALPLAENIVVTGALHDELIPLVSPYGGRSIYNPRYAEGEMLSSFQTGLNTLPNNVAACLVFLGDQPQLNLRLIYQILIRYAEGGASIVAPSYKMRRGHPILIDRQHWDALRSLPDGKAPRDVINQHQDQTAYVVTQDPNILNDLDTPEQYQAALKRAELH